ncbi:MAG: hypothetical protein ACI91G_000322 [Gammaproteobacteria bacterium]|jgi:uncharacterized protein YqeY
MSLKDQIREEMKTAMKGGNKPRLAVIRLMMAAVKQIEIDERKELNDAEVLAVIDKMNKQRRESIKQYEEADRQDLADIELAEVEVLKTFLPEPLSADEVNALIDAAIASTGAAGMQDMGKVMGILKPQLQGRADMGPVSGQIKARLG